MIVHFTWLQYESVSNVYVPFDQKDAGTSGPMSFPEMFSRHLYVVLIIKRLGLIFT